MPSISLFLYDIEMSCSIVYFFYTVCFHHRQRITRLPIQNLASWAKICLSFMKIIKFAPCLTGNITFFLPFSTWTCTIKYFIAIIVCRVCIGQIFEFVKVILFLKTYLESDLALSSQTKGSLLIPLADKAS